MLDLPDACDILVVEDDDAVAAALTAVLTDEGYRVMRAEHGRDALDHLQLAPAIPRMILLDVMMPVMDGLELRSLLLVHPVWRKIPVVVLSAIGSRLRPDELARLNAVAYIPKPIDWARLDEVIAQHCPLV